jgi:hypothetical protein
MKPRRLRLIICQSTTGSHVPDGSWLRAIVAGSIGDPGSPSEVTPSADSTMS